MWTHPFVITSLSVLGSLLIALAVVWLKRRHAREDRIAEAIAILAKDKLNGTDWLRQVERCKKRFEKGDEDFEHIKLGMVAIYEKQGGDGTEMARLLSGG
jgi:hypothetical protein